MSLYFSEQPEIFRSHWEQRFSPFEDGESALPDCHIHFHERPKDMLAGKTRLKRVGDHSFYKLDDGILIANATSFAAVRENYSAIDMYLPPNGLYAERQVAFLMLQAYRYVLAAAGQFQMHSAVVMHEGQGIAFCGLSGAGKSTQAHLWEEHMGAEALNLDQPVILFDNDKVLVSGSPWSGKEDCYKNTVVPLKAIFFVEQANENSARKMSPAEAFSHLFLHNFLMPVDEAIEKKHHAAITKVATGVPIYNLKCTISAEAVQTAYRAAFQDNT